MLKLIKIYLFGCVSAAASAAAHSLPVEIVQAQRLLVQQTTCEVHWAKLSQAQNFAIEPGLQLWLVPCSDWNLNVTWTAYLQIKESTHKHGRIIKPVSFVNLDFTGHWTSSLLLSNMQYDADKHLLAAQQYFQSGSACGTIASYEWDSAQQYFTLRQLYKNDVCAGIGPWSQVYPTPAAAPEQPTAAN